MSTKAYYLLSLFSTCILANYIYYIDEENESNTFIGDAVKGILPWEFYYPLTKVYIAKELVEPIFFESQLFRISKDKKMYTIKKLDAETLCKHNQECILLNTVMTLKWTSEDYFEFKVILRDINDNKPEFSKREISIQFSESDHEGKKVPVSNAVDKDVSLANSQIVYRLKKNADEPFGLSSIENATSKLTINLEGKLDREYRNSYNIQVIAEDRGDPPQHSVLDVHITVTDENDNEPIFSQEVYNVTIKNKASGMKPIVKIFATDLDVGKNGDISYHIDFYTSVVIHSHFKLDKMSGEIFLRKKFTPDRDACYKLFVNAKDNGFPCLSAHAVVLINMVSYQNTAPKISVDFRSDLVQNAKTVLIPEDINMGSFVASVLVTDYDMEQNGEISCSLHHKSFQLESLGPKQYKMTIKSLLNRKKVDDYDITISCKDKGLPPLHSESKFSFRVVDVNDVQSYFSKNIFKFSIYENRNSKFHVGFLNATDLDGGTNTELTFSLIKDNNDYLPFQIASDGVISTIEPLDREFQDTYEFQVLIKDKSMPSMNNTANIIIRIMDENDNAPYFEFPDTDPYTLDVHYPLSPENVITVVRARDNDSRENAFLSYQIITKGNQKQLFNIKEYTGQLSFSHLVTAKDAGRYNLQIVVRDFGDPVLSAMTTLCLIVRAANESTQSLSAVQITSDIKVHKNLVVIIVLIAMIVSIAVVVSTTLAIVQAKDRCQNKHEDTADHPTDHPDRCIGEQKQLIYFSQHKLPRLKYIEDIQNSELLNFDQESDFFHDTSKDDGYRYDPSLEHMPVPNGTLRPYAQFVGGPTSLTSGRGSRESPFLSPDYHSDDSTMSPHTDSGYGLSDDTGQSEDLYTSRHFLSQPYQADLLQSSEYNRKVSQRMFNTFSLTRKNGIPAKYFYKPKQQFNESNQKLERTNLKSAIRNHGRSEDRIQPLYDALSQSSSDTSPTPTWLLPPLPRKAQAKTPGKIPREQYIVRALQSEL